jgi:hypothetical protein
MTFRISDSWSYLQISSNLCSRIRGDENSRTSYRDMVYLVANVIVIPMVDRFLRCVIVQILSLAILANAGWAHTPTIAAKMKPCANNMKLNVDAAFSVDELAGHRCNYMGLSHRFYSGIVFFHTACVFGCNGGTMAMLHGLDLVNTIGGNDFDAKVDSLEVIQLCLGENRIWNEATSIHADVFSQDGNIGKVEFMHCGRDPILVAHELARNSFSFKIS